MLRRGWGSAIVAVILCACSDSGDDSLDACEPVVACGGDVVGTWRLGAACPDQVRERAVDTLEEELPPECSGSLQSAESDASNVSLTFDESGTLTVSGTQVLRLEYTLSDACVAALDPASGGASEASCNELGPGMMGMMSMEAGEFGVATCNFRAGACACEYFFQPDVSTSGPYALAGDFITIEGEELSYCVSGDVLRLGLPSLGTSTARRQ